MLCIIVAAGRGSRFGGEVPKQFRLLCGKPVVLQAVEAMRRSFPAAETVVVLSEHEIELWPALCAAYGVEPPRTAPGGATRYQSVKSALDAYGAGRKVIAVHDGARPVIDPHMAARLRQALSGKTMAVVPAVAVTDSLRRRMDDGSSEAVDRSQYVAVQTPQLFNGPALIAAYSHGESPAFTDDASVMEAAGHTVELVEGDVHNIKITHPSDIEIAAIYLKA